MTLDLIGLGVLVLMGLAAIAYGVYDLWTMPPDDERWEIIAEAQRWEWGRNKFE